MLTEMCKSLQTRSFNLSLEHHEKLADKYSKKERNDLILEQQQKQIESLKLLINMK